MLDFVADVWGGQVVEQSLEVVADLDLIFILAPILPLDEVFIDIFDQEGLDERRVFFLLVVARRLPRIHEDGGRKRRRQDLWWLVVAVIDVEQQQQVKLNACVRPNNYLRCCRRWRGT